MSLSSNIYLFVISSLNHPVYRKIQQKRKKLLKYYNIPYSVLINEQESVIEDRSVATLVPLREEEIFYNGGGYNPYMAQKFLMAVKMFFRSFEKYDNIPNYIVRINATVYVHYPSLLSVLNDENFPKERVLAGGNWGDMFVQGMVMVFSKDVLLNMLKDPRIYSKDIMRNNDDVSLSVLADPYSKWIDWSKHMCMMRECTTDNKGLYLPEKFKPIENKKWIFRIYETDKNDSYNRNIDLKNWDILLKYFNEYKLTTPPPPIIIHPTAEHETYEPDLMTMWWMTMFLLLVVIMWVRCKHHMLVSAV